MRFQITFCVLALLSVGVWNAAHGAQKPDPPKQDPKAEWGKEVNGLAVSIAPSGDDQSKLVVRWKNVGKETLEVPWVRFGSDAAYKHLDDLLDHTFAKSENGKLLPARKYKAPIIGGPPYRPRTVILKPDMVHEEKINLWTYVDKPAEDGMFQCWIELDIGSAFAPSVKGATYWKGKVESNVVKLKLGK